MFKALFSLVSGVSVSGLSQDWKRKAGDRGIQVLSSWIRQRLDRSRTWDTVRARGARAEHESPEERRVSLQLAPSHVDPSPETDAMRTVWRGKSLCGHCAAHGPSARGYITEDDGNVTC